MAQTATHAHPSYMAIFWWLAVLTVLELAVLFTGLPKVVVVILLCSLALAKASLVAMYFMHLRTRGAHAADDRDPAGAAPRVGRQPARAPVAHGAGGRGAGGAALSAGGHGRVTRSLG